ncbi:MULTISPECIES: LysR family transcriptional regulator [Thermomonosporaceae]|uniref:LysR family transcriptional regulator n=1 Tax=Thermomonosporaceae TaxID=2012 RepID=UPI00255AA684|nr:MULTISPECIES: LysR family transcriptional regulator [Thermomonosporaceae]MDL4775432.1 LysR family transcriptional regulator [Actinomadura xylanilytica]
MSDSEAESLAGWREDGADLPQLDDLRMFVAIARAGSLRAAAGALFTSQPTLSRSVARLEARLGVRLLRRGARGVEPTRHGEALLVQAQRVLAAAADLRRNVTALASGTLRLGATATSARRLLAPFLSEWMPAHPGVQVTAIEDSERRLHAHLETGRCDIAIVSGPLSAQTASVHLMTAQVIALFPPGHPASRHDRPVRVPDLAGEPLLVNGTAFPSTALLLRAMDAAAARPDVVYECTAGQTLAAMAEAGLGVAVFADTADLRGFSLPRHDVLDAAGTPLRFDLYAAWPRDTAPGWVREFAIELSTFHRSVVI